LIYVTLADYEKSGYRRAILPPGQRKTHPPDSIPAPPPFFFSTDLEDPDETEALTTSKAPAGA